LACRVQSIQESRGGEREGGDGDGDAVLFFLSIWPGEFSFLFFSFLFFSFPFLLFLLVPIHLLWDLGSGNCHVEKHRNAVAHILASGEHNRMTTTAAT
jgi:hypothetical protein